MGFQQAVPPVPERIDEIKMLDRLQQSWLNQPFYKYYMQQDLRQTKMEYYQYANKGKQKYLANCLIVSLFTLPLAYFTRRFYVYTSFGSRGIPYLKKMPYFQKQRTSAYERNFVASKTFLLVWIVSTAIFASALTQVHTIQDENYNIFSKVKKML